MEEGSGKCVGEKNFGFITWNVIWDVQSPQYNNSNSGFSSFIRQVLW
jgi:hypothetical protein